MVFALMALYTAEVRGVLFARAVIVLLAATAVGFAHQVADYFAMCALARPTGTPRPAPGC